MNDDAVERVSHAMWDAYTDCEPTFPQWDQVGEREQSRFRYQAAAAIAAHNAWLRERNEQAAKAMYEHMTGLVWERLADGWRVSWRNQAAAALDAMIGKEQDDER